MTRLAVLRHGPTAWNAEGRIQGVIALENSFNRMGLDQVVLVKVASTAVAAQMLGGTHDEIVNALGSKGVGEIGLVPTAGAVGAALHDLDGQWRSTLPMRRDQQED